MSKTVVNGINIHYQRMGQGPDVVMVHGIASNLALWLNIQRALLGEFRVTTYDLRGHGYSDAPATGYTSADMADDLNALLNELGIKQTYLVGHSFGGLVALHYTVLHPERVIKLVLADTGIPAVEPSRKGKSIIEAWKERLDKFGVDVPDDKQDDMAYLMGQTRKLRQGLIQNSGMKRRRMGALPSIQRLTRLMETTSILDEFRSVAGLTLDKINKIAHPVLISYGDRSPSMATCKYLREHLPHCTSVIVPNAGHFHLLAHPEIFVKNLRAFLRADDLKDELTKGA